jgi:hypothetical protein
VHKVHKVHAALLLRAAYGMRGKIGEMIFRWTSTIFAGGSGSCLTGIPR